MYFDFFWIEWENECKCLLCRNIVFYLNEVMFFFNLYRMIEKKIFKYVDLIVRIIGCCMRVYIIFGCGYCEVIYECVLKIELEKVGFLF